jgi:hypothetical protein
MFTKKQIILIVSLGLIFVAIGGCGTTFTVDHYPDFYNPSIKSVAVLPFENETTRKEAGMVVANHVSAALAANGTYEITTPSHIETILKEKQMPALQTEDYRATAEELAQLSEFQAFITGKVLSESFKNITTEYYYDDDFYYYDYPYWYYPDWYPPYWYYPYYYEFGQDAYISADVSMVSVPDGTVLDTKPIKASADVSGMSSSLKRHATQMALINLTEKVVSIFAVIPVKITVHPSKAMRTADKSGPEEWLFTKTFYSDQESMYVVLCLPEAATMNKFELTITPQNSLSNVILSRTYIWQKNKYCQDVEFSPRQIAQTNGPGKYSVHFSSRGKVVMTKNFRIKQTL